MGYHDKMRELLRPLGLYRLDMTSLSDRELSVYAAAIDAAQERIIAAGRSAYPFSANDAELDSLAAALGVQEMTAGLPTQRKKGVLCALFAPHATRFTNADFYDVIRLLGIGEAAFTVDGESGIVTLTVGNSQESPAQDGPVYRFLSRLMPAGYSLTIA